MANENGLKPVQLSSGLSFQNTLINELNKSAESIGQQFTEYGNKCVLNAISALVIYCKNNGTEIKEFEPNLVRLALQNVGYTELNIAAIPSECYFDIRKTKDGKKTITIKPQGAGNEKLLRTYGVNVKDLKSPWLVREGDEFTYPSYDGWNINPPKWSPKSFDKKVIMVVYPLLKNDGSHEYLIATREGIKPNIIAQARQNTLYGKPEEKAIFQRLEEKAESLTVDEILNDKDYARIINPTYTSGGSKESMIIRKMCNNALKNYPKEYRDSYMSDAVRNMFEDKDDSLDEEKVIDAETNEVEKVEKEINEEVTGEPVKDFDVEPEKEEPKVEESPKETDYEF